MNLLDEAQSILIKAIDTEKIDLVKLYLLNQLGYTFLLKRDSIRAKEKLEEAINLDIPEDMSNFDPEILGAVFVKDDKILPDPYMNRTEPKYVAMSNLAITDLFNGDFDQATSLAINIISKSPKNSLGYELFGFIALAREDNITVVEAWNQALEHADAPGYKEYISDHIEDLT